MNINNINYAELYGVRPYEKDFTGAIKRALHNGCATHIGADFLNALADIRKKRKKHI